MTLCIAEKRGNAIYFVSDSRIAFEHNHIDFGVKIFKLPVVVRSATSSVTGTSELLYNHTLGLCVIGSTVNSYLVKETVFEILQNLQYCGIIVDFSMESFCKIITKIYEKFSRDICNIMDRRGIAQLVLGGYCPELNRIRMFHFELEDSSHPITAKVSEILEEPGMKFFGSGAKKAKEFFAAEPNNCFHILRSVINDPAITSVGGPIQTGIFEGNDFEIKGVEDYLLTQHGMFEYRHSLRGINLYTEQFEQLELGFHVSYNFLAPFGNDLRKATSDRFKNVTANLNAKDADITEA